MCKETLLHIDEDNEEENCKILIYNDVTCWYLLEQARLHGCNNRAVLLASSITHVCILETSNMLANHIICGIGKYNMTIFSETF